MRPIMRLGHGSEFTPMRQPQMLQDKAVQPLLDRPYVLEPKEIPGRSHQLKRIKTGRNAVAKGKELHSFAPRMQLASHLEGDRAAAAVTGDAVRSLRLDLLHAADAVCSHRLDSGIGRRLAVETASRKPVQRLVRREVACQVVVKEEMSADDMRAKQRSALAACLHGYGSRPERRSAVVDERARQTFDSPRLVPQHV